MEGRQLPFHHTVSLPLFLFVLALLACLQLALCLAVLILGGQGPFQGEKIYFGSQFKVAQSVAEGKSRHQEPEATGHMAATVGTEW